MVRVLPISWESGFAVMLGMKDGYYSSSWRVKIKGCWLEGRHCEVGQVGLEYSVFSCDQKLTSECIIHAQHTRGRVDNKYLMKG